MKSLTSYLIQTSLEFYQFCRSLARPLHEYGTFYNTMVYCGKPSRGCQMCRTRRIKVCLFRIVCLYTSSQIFLLIASNCSAMRPNQLVDSVRSLDDNVQGIKTILISSSGMKLKPPNEEHVERGVRRRLTPISPKEAFKQS